MKYLIRMAYDGSKFYGFQRLNGKETVQGALERALTILNQGPVIIKGAGRTDRGVHARGQCAHFELNDKFPTKNLVYALNKILHPSIHILNCEEVNDEFHARFSVKKKKYVYQIWTGDYSPFRESYYLQYNRKINLKKLNECAKMFIGKHDFHNFVSGDRNNYNAIIFNIEIKYEEEKLNVILEGKSFYRYMVRNIVGAMLDYNEDRCDLNLIEKMLNNSEFNYQLRTVQASGLYLEEIDYEE